MRRFPSTLLLAVFTIACAADPRPAADATVRDLIDRFGQRLKDVSLLAPDAAQQIETAYSAFVTDELLQSWVGSPQDAPGRVTSSPWPDRIEILRLVPQGEAYTVSAEIIERTSTGDEVRRVPVTIALTRHDGEWRISEWTAEDIEKISAAQFLPVDEAASDPSFARFRERLLDIVRRKDRDALLAVLDPGIRVSFGAEGGREDFIKHWKLDEPQSPLWSTLEWILLHGGTFRGQGANGMFWAPYVYSAWPEAYDAFEHLAVTGGRVSMRAEPRDDAAVITTLSNEIVRIGGPPRGGWREVETVSGRRGWVPTRWLRSPIDYRAGFHRRDGEWKLAALVAGD